METPDKVILQLEERPSGQPEALKAWFYPVITPALSLFIQLEEVSLIQPRSNT